MELIHLVEFGLWVVFLGVANWLLKRLVRHFKLRYPGEWRSHLDEILVAPIRIFLWILFISFLSRVIAAEFGVEVDLSSLQNIALILQYLKNWHS